MIYIGQLGIILAVSLLGELLYQILPFAIPASIYGLLLMLLLLCTKVIRLHQVEQTAGFLLDILPLLLVPVTVGLMTGWSQLSQILLPFLLITLLGTLAVMGVSGLVTQRLMRGRQKKEGEGSGDAGTDC